MDRQAHNDGGETEILLVEDNPGDVRLVEEALREYDATLHVTKGGNEALDFLYQRGEFTDAPRPDLVFLDLNLPSMNGDEILEEMRDHSAFDSIRVVILTSADEWAVEPSVLDADGFHTKPTDPDEFMSLIRSEINR